MKKILLGMALLTATAVQAIEDNDTTIINNAHKVMVITNDSLQKIKVVGKEQDKNYVYENLLQIVDTNYVSESRTYRDLKSIGWGVGKKDKDGWSSNSISLHAAFGANFPTKVSNGFDFRQKGTWDAMLWLQYTHTPKYKLQSYSIGLGVTARSYSLRDDMMFSKDANGVVGLSSYPAGTSSRSSSISSLSLSVPLLFHQKFGRNSHYSLTLGPVVNFNLRSTLQNDFDYEDDTYNITTRNLKVRPVTVDLMAIFRMYGFGFYLKYTPMNMFKTNYGPKFHSLTFGICF